MTVQCETPAGDDTGDTAASPVFRDLRTLPGTPSRRGGAHRVPAPPHAIKGRAAVVAVAAGAVVAAGQTLTDGPAGGQGSTSSDAIALASGSSMVLSDAAEGVAQAADDAAGALTQASGDPSAPAFGSTGAGPQVLGSPDVMQQAAETARQLAAGARYAAERAAADALARRPLYVKPASGKLTSHYGTRWGTIHGGVDIANAMYTPIYAATDGEVISAGPASGFGQWVRIRADDGTVTVYGHIETIEVHEGQRVTAGDEIAKMGSRGFSTGPHLHFEVWEHGTQRIDPEPWLAQRGILLTN